MKPPTTAGSVDVYPPTTTAPATTSTTKLPTTQTTSIPMATTDSNPVTPGAGAGETGNEIVSRDCANGADFLPHENCSKVGIPDPLYCLPCAKMPVLDMWSNTGRILVCSQDTPVNRKIATSRSG